MAPVTASTNRDSPKIDLAGVDAGAKIFVGLKGWAVSAKAAAAPQIQTTTCDFRTRQLLEPLDRNWSPYFGGSASQLKSKFLRQSTTYLQLIQTKPMTLPTWFPLPRVRTYVVEFWNPVSKPFSELLTGWPHAQTARSRLREARTLFASGSFAMMH